MKKAIIRSWEIALVVLVTLVAGSASAQIRVGPPTGALAGSASLEVKSGPYSSGSPYRGLLAPTVTTAQRSQIQNPATGLIIFNTTTNQIEVNTGTTTTPVWTPGGAVGTGNGAPAWNLTGNAGTVSSTNFLGTTDNVPFNFRVNNQNSGRIDHLLYNVALGYLALNSAATGQGNTAVGTFALTNSTSGNYNTASGFQALNNNTTGVGNAASGALALEANTNGQYNSALGFKALYQNTTGSGNTASGSVALQANTSGQNNTALGTVALTANTTGNNNTASGAGALQSNTTGYENAAIGSNSLRSNTIGYSNIGVGTDALYNNIDGDDNTAFGGSALLSNTTGNGNMASGNLALRNNTTGQSNTASGTIALRYNTTGNFNTALGYNAGSAAAAPGLNNATAIGANALVSASNTIVLGDNAVTALRCNVQTISTLSDKRVKENINANVPGLSFITKLTPVTYHINKMKEAKLVGYPLTNVKEDKTLHSGFLAQDVEMAAKAVGYNFEGVGREEGGKYYTIGYTLFVIPLVQAVKDLNGEVEKLKAKIQEGETAYNQLAAQVKQMQEMLGISKAETSAKTGAK